MKIIKTYLVQEISNTIGVPSLIDVPQSARNFSTTFNSIAS